MATSGKSPIAPTGEGWWYREIPPTFVYDLATDVDRALRCLLHRLAVETVNGLRTIAVLSDDETSVRFIFEEEPGTSYRVEVSDRLIVSNPLRYVELVTAWIARGPRGGCLTLSDGDFNPSCADGERR